MGLFKDLSIYLHNQELNLHVKQHDGKLLVTILSKPNVDDTAKELLSPMIYKGTPEELDEKLSEALKGALGNISEITDNIKEFEASTKKYAAENKVKDELKKKNKEALDKAVKDLEKCTEYITKREFDKAEFLVKKVLELDAENKKAKEIAEAIKKANPQQVDIFSTIAEVMQEEKPAHVGTVTDSFDNTTIDDHDDLEESEEEEMLEEDVDDNDEEIIEDSFYTEEIIEETDDDIKDALFNFEIEEESKLSTDFNFVDAEIEFIARKEYEQQQQQQQQDSSNQSLLRRM